MKGKLSTAEIHAGFWAAHGLSKAALEGAILVIVGTERVSIRRLRKALNNHSSPLGSLFRREYRHAARHNFEVPHRTRHRRDRRLERAIAALRARHRCTNLR